MQNSKTFRTYKLTGRGHTISFGFAAISKIRRGKSKQKYEVFSQARMYYTIHINNVFKYILYLSKFRYIYINFFRFVRHIIYLDTQNS